MKNATESERLNSLLKRVPRWMCLDYSLIETLADLQYQVEHEIVLVQGGEGSICIECDRLPNHVINQRMRSAQRLLKDVLNFRAEATA
jgi:hypothetical protein